MASSTPLDRSTVTPRSDDARSRADRTSSSPQVKPRLRGWLHAGHGARWPPRAASCSCPRADAGRPGRCAIFLAASLLLFGTSAIYHRFSWGPRGEAVLRRMDHANIYVFIAATYTPLALLFCRPHPASCC